MRKSQSRDREMRILDHGFQQNELVFQKFWGSHHLGHLVKKFQLIRSLPTILKLTNNPAPCYVLWQMREESNVHVVCFLGSESEKPLRITIDAASPTKRYENCICVRMTIAAIQEKKLFRFTIFRCDGTSIRMSILDTVKTMHTYSCGEERSPSFPLKHQVCRAA